MILQRPARRGRVRGREAATLEAVPRGLVWYKVAKVQSWARLQMTHRLFEGLEWHGDPLVGSPSVIVSPAAHDTPILQAPDNEPPILSIQ